MNIILRLLFNALGLMLIAELLPGISVTGFYPALIAALILGVVNLFVRPIILLFTLPISLLTLGLFAFVINALLFWFVSSFVEGFSVDGFWYALLGSLLMSVVSTVGSRWIKTATRSGITSN